MIQKCSYSRVLEVFFKEPTKIHFIREVGRKVSLTQSPVRNHIKDLEKEGLIKKQEAKPFDGFVANRDNEGFISLKQVYNLYSLIGLKNEIIQKMGPRALILFGSYQKGEDVENSDIDLLVISKVKKDINLEEYEKSLARNIHITFAKDTDSLDKSLMNNIKNGWVLYGSR